jgi:hypothetical protein
MPDDFTDAALARVDAFITAHPEYARQGVQQPGHGSTNRVFCARLGHEPVIFKVFCEAERKERELFGLRHWRKTGLVPRLICDADAMMIVMSYVPGVYLHQVREADGDTARHRACREAGNASGALTCVPLSDADRAAFESRFYQDLPTLEAYLGRILELGRGVNVRDPDFQGHFWRESLDFIQAELAGILSQPRVLFHQDAANLHIADGRFAGFFDLEMCRVGCAAMQLASSLRILEGDDAGWEAGACTRLSESNLRAAVAAWHPLSWREICRYLSYDGTPGTGFAWASPADPVRYRRSIEAIRNMLGVEWR